MAPAKRSDAALDKVHSKRLTDGTTAHSFRTLLEHLGTIVRNVCTVPGKQVNESHFEVTTTPNAKQRLAYALLHEIAV